MPGYLLRISTLIGMIAISPLEVRPSGAAPVPEFEVVSVKPSRALEAGQNVRLPMTFDPVKLTAKYFSLKRLIAEAYGVQNYQVSGGPGWLDSIRYDVEARATAPSKSSDLLLMLQGMLADRFRLKFHRETRTMAIRAMVLAKSGPRFLPAKAGAVKAPARPGFLRFRNLPESASRLSYFGSEFPVIDQTGLHGDFDIEINWAKVEHFVQSGESKTVGEAMASVAQEDLGLKLVMAKGPVDVIVVDHAEQASAN
ncbi:MAG TPA: TIGR03435 family protein [Bryobacteraceae bacterium]|jgi:uncharacterized protein (TIGR03435 family)|nr:TIGR03435 family protein [Bryobacteraceae bacterium]